MHEPSQFAGAPNSSPVPHSPRYERVLKGVERMLRDTFPNLIDRAETPSLFRETLRNEFPRLASAIREIFGVKIVLSDIHPLFHSMADLATIVDRRLSLAAKSQPNLTASTLPEAPSNEDLRKSPAKSFPSLGTWIGPYRIDRLLGGGSFAVTFLASAKSGKKVTLKFGRERGGSPALKWFSQPTSFRSIHGLSPDQGVGDVWRPGSNGQFEPRRLVSNEIDNLLLEEAKVTGFIQSPLFRNIIETLTFGDRQVLVFPYANGKTLRELIRNLEKVHLNSLLKIVEDLNQHGYSHRDLKPDNIIIGSTGKITLIDPGFSLPKSGDIVTTARYNPLLLKDSQADVMAIGTMLYEILTGYSPFERFPFATAGRALTRPADALARSWELSYVPPLDRNKKTPPGLQDIIYRCLTIPSYSTAALERDLSDLIRKLSTPQ